MLKMDLVKPNGNQTMRLKLIATSHFVQEATTFHGIVRRVLGWIYLSTSRLANAHIEMRRS